MKNSYKVVPVFALLILFFTGIFVVTSVWGADVTPLAGITVKDEHPNGCVDCHRKVDDERDYRLSVGLAHIEKHPPIEKIVKTVPKDCFMCHKEGSKARPLNIIVHKVHFVHPEENHFVSIYKGDCLNCHSLDMNTFQMGIKSGPANW